MMMEHQAGGRGPGAASSLGSRGGGQGSDGSEAAEEGRGGAFQHWVSTFTSSFHLDSFSSQVSAMAKQLSKAEQEMASMKKKKK